MRATRMIAGDRNAFFLPASIVCGRTDKVHALERELTATRSSLTVNYRGEAFQIINCLCNCR